MRTLLLAALLPGVLWKQDPGKVEALKKAGVAQVYQSDESVVGYDKVPAPHSQMRMNSASATTVPWVDANGWRFVRGLRKAFYPQVSAGSGPLAMAEAFAYGVDAVVEPAPEDLDGVEKMARFLQKIGSPSLPPMANIGVIDDGSPELGEVLNLLGRRNLLYAVEKAPNPKLDLNIRVGDAQYPKSAVSNPNDFAARVREKLTDEKRLLRLYGSYTVIGHLNGDGNRVRLHLLNYSPRPATDVRVRVKGIYESIHLADSTDTAQHAADVAIQDGGTEFSIAQLKTYAVVDLQRNR